MSEVEIMNYIKKILGKYEKIIGIKTFSGKNTVVCLDYNNCITIYNYKLNITWDENDLPTEIIIEGKDQNGQIRTFKTTLTWETNPATGTTVLKEVSPWTEV